MDEEEDFENDLEFEKELSSFQNRLENVQVKAKRMKPNISDQWILNLKERLLSSEKKEKFEPSYESPQRVAFEDSDIQFKNGSQISNHD